MAIFRSAWRIHNKISFGRFFLHNSPTSSSSSCVVLLLLSPLAYYCCVHNTHTYIQRATRVWIRFVNNAHMCSSGAYSHTERPARIHTWLVRSERKCCGEFDDSAVATQTLSRTHTHAYSWGISLFNTNRYAANVCDFLAFHSNLIVGTVQIQNVVGGDKAHYRRMYSPFLHRKKNKKRTCSLRCFSFVEFKWKRH